MSRPNDVHSCITDSHDTFNGNREPRNVTSCWNRGTKERYTKINASNIHDVRCSNPRVVEADRTPQHRAERVTRFCDPIDDGRYDKHAALLAATLFDIETVGVVRRSLMTQFGRSVRGQRLSVSGRSESPPC